MVFESYGTRLCGEWVLKIRKKVPKLRRLCPSKRVEGKLGKWEGWLGDLLKNHFMDEGAIRHVKRAMKMRTGLGNIADDFDSSSSRGVIGNPEPTEPTNWVLEGMEMERRQPTQTVLSKTFALKWRLSKYGVWTSRISTIWDLRDSQSWAPSNESKTLAVGPAIKVIELKLSRTNLYDACFHFPPLPGEERLLCNLQ